MKLFSVRFESAFEDPSKIGDFQAWATAVSCETSPVSIEKVDDMVVVTDLKSGARRCAPWSAVISCNPGPVAQGKSK